MGDEYLRVNVNMSIPTKMLYEHIVMYKICTMIFRMQRFKGVALNVLRRLMLKTTHSTQQN